MRRIKLNCGHGRHIVEGSDEMLDVREKGIGYCFRCKDYVAVAGWTAPVTTIDDLKRKA